VKSCPACDSSVWQKDKMAAVMLSLPERYHILRCGKCGLRFLSPQLTDLQQKELYDQDYFGARYVPALPKRKEKTYRFLKSVMKLEMTDVRFLDFGAGTGELISVALHLGFDAWGYETSNSAIALAREDVRKRMIMDWAKFNKEFSDGFNVVYLNHVLEHLNDPLLKLREIRQIIKDEGVLYIEVPFQFHWVERLLYKLGRPVPGFSKRSLHHAFFFNPKSISLILERAGFSVQSMRVFDPPRYDKSNRLKKMAWVILSMMNTGNYIEVIARYHRKAPDRST